MSVWYAQESNGNWSDSTQWNSAINGSGSWGTPFTGDTCDLNGKTVNVNNTSFVTPASIVDGSGGNGLLLFNTSISDGRTFVCSCNVKIAAGVTVSMVPGALSVYHVSGTCGKLDIAGTLNMATAAGAGAIGVYSGAVPVTVETGGVLTMQTNAHIPTLYNSTAVPVIVVSGTLNWPAANSWGGTGWIPQLLSGGTINVLNSSGTSVGTITPAGGTIPPAADVLSGVAVGSTTGTLTLPTAANVWNGNGNYGVGGNGSTPTLILPPANYVYAGRVYGVGGNGSTGTCNVPDASDVLSGVAVRLGTGALTLPAAGSVANGVT